MGRALRRAVVALLAIALLWSAPIADAAAATTCGFDEPTGVATVAVGDGATVTISRLGDAVAVDGTPCETATVTTTDLIDVLVPDVDLAETVVVDVSGGPLAPGATDEGDGSSEIEIAVDFATAILDTLRVVGSAERDVIDVGFYSVNLNADEETSDDDISSSDDSVHIELFGGDGNDRLTLDLFNPFGYRKLLQGGPGDDRLSGDGSREGSDLDGGPGHDVGDYAWTCEVLLRWESEGATISYFGGPPEDSLSSIERVVLGPCIDDVVYSGEATGETRAGEGGDDLRVEPSALTAVPSERLLGGGPGLDTLEFATDADQQMVVNLPDRIATGAWTGAFRSIEYVVSGDGDDRFLADRYLDYWGLNAGEGSDILDLHLAERGLEVSASAFGTMNLAGLEVILGTPYADEMLAGDGVVLYGLSGHDDLAGTSSADEMFGGPGRDEMLGLGASDHLRGGSGDDVLRGWFGADLLEGNEGDDELLGESGDDDLRGGGGDDVLAGGVGDDSCDGGPGVNSFTGC